jgi:hypothetical protein
MARSVPRSTRIPKIEPFKQRPNSALQGEWWRSPELLKRYGPNIEFFQNLGKSESEIRRDSEFKFGQNLEGPDQSKTGFGLWRRLPIDKQYQQRQLIREYTALIAAETKRQNTYSALDGQPDIEAKNALKNYLESDLTAKRISLTSWRFTTPPSLAELDRVLRLAQAKLPGKVELGLFLDEKTYGESYRSIVAAWGRPTSEPPASDLISTYMSIHRGKTLLVVGHVERDSYVFENANGERVSVNIKEMLAEAHKNQIALIPIGCSTANAGVGFGFVREIGTDSVSSFLKSFPKENPQTADLLNRLAQIGEVRVNIRDFADLFEIQVYKPEGDERITVTRLPYTSSTGNTSAQQLSSTLIQTVEADAEEARPFFQKAWVLAILTNPFTYIAVWAGMLACSWSGSILIRRWAFERRDRQWLYRVIRLPMHISLILFGIGSVVLVLGSFPYVGYEMGGLQGAAVGSVISLIWIWIEYVSAGKEA